MSLIINGMNLPKHSAVNGKKDTAYKCVILAHPDNSVELVIDTKFASPYDNGHNIQRCPLTELPAPHGRLIDADILLDTIRYGAEGRAICDKCKSQDCQNCVIKSVYKIIRKAPTVIEAEA